MPTEKPRVTFTIDATQLASIEDYRFRNRMKSQTQAILSLIEHGFVEVEKRERTLPIATPAQDDVHTMAELFLQQGIIREGTILSTHDRAFLQSILHTASIYFNTHYGKEE